MSDLTDAKHDFIRDLLGVDPRSYPPRPAAAGGTSGMPDAAAPLPPPPGGLDGDLGHDEGAGSAASAPEPPPSPALKGPLKNPFDVPAAHLELERCTLPIIQNLAVQQAQNARSDFTAAITKVKAAKKAQADAEQAKREFWYGIAITIALMPAGPLVEAASVAIAGPALKSKMLAALVDNAPKIAEKYGTKGDQLAGKAFDVIAGDAVSKLAAKFDAAKAKSALDAGVGALKDKTVKFAASSDKDTCLANYLDAMLKAANDSMHNLTDVILSTKTYSEALAFYTYFSKPLQAIYEAQLGQQADHMLDEIATVMAKQASTGFIDSLTTGNKPDAIYQIDAYGRTLFAHVEHYMTPTKAGIIERWEFVKWVTPDMEPMAAKLSVGKLDPRKIAGHLPDPQREPGERIVRVDAWGRLRLVLVEIEDQGIFNKDYGVRTFKRWPRDAEDEQGFEGRGAIQIGGIDTVPAGSIKGLKQPPG